MRRTSQIIVVLLITGMAGPGVIALSTHDSARIKTQTVLPSAETAAMLFWAPLASGQIRLRKVDGWRTLGRKLAQPIDLAA